MHFRDVVANVLFFTMLGTLIFLLFMAFAPGCSAHGIPDEYIRAIKQNEGFSRKAYWDHQQWSIGYGTRARYPGEVIDEEEAERRFFTELSKAAEFVDENFPGLDEGTRAALASLTYNAGPGWANARLGALIRAGDMDGAKRVFLSYVRASGQVLSGLVARRKQEAAWFGAVSAAVAAFFTRECRMPDGTTRFYKATE